jgi:signal transduction histidine kinase
MTNSVIGDSRVHDQEWAKKEGLVAFAGYPLIVEDRLVGVMAMFSRQPLTDFALKALASVADSIALGIERKQTEEAIKRYARELEESNRMKELFIDIMHHDLLNPLTAASGYIELLQEEQMYPKKNVYLEGVKKSLVRAHELIENATMFSKLRSLESIDFEDMDLKEVIGRVVENLAPLVSRAGMITENNITHTMPVSGNKMIEEVFANLLSNAVKYAPKGKRIIIDSMATGEFWRIRVIDFGDGISDADKTRIFDRFLRIEKKGVKGSGLGLAIAERIVELHKGRIWVEGNPEGGAVFVVEIPKRKLH